jgi:hypothetical protein
MGERPPGVEWPVPETRRVLALTKKLRLNRTVQGTIHGRTVELSEDSGLVEGQAVEVQIKPVESSADHAELQEVCDRIAKGIPFKKEERQKAAAEIDRRREANAKRLGIQNVAVDIVRAMRDSR